jgi:lysophospholipase L1-like esterase
MLRLTAFWHLSVRSSLMAIVMMTAAGCGHHGNGMTPPDPVGALAIACPADFTKQVEQTPASVTFDAPVATGGVAPIATSCSPASGTSFPTGVTDVLCVATDANQARAQCVFHLTVDFVGRLQGTRFLAFGDSITAGEDGTDSSPAWRRPSNVNDAIAYPTVLTKLLKDRYTSQAGDIVVTNAGVSLEKAASDDAQQRLVDEIDASHPDVLLLLEGTNDVNDYDSLDDIDKVAQALTHDVTRAQQHGVKLVLLSTLLPQVGRPRGENPDGIAPTNDAIRDVAARTGAVLVDAYAAFEPQKTMLISADGLHPTTDGYALLAKVFLDAIAANFQQAAAPAAPQMFRRPATAQPSPVRPRAPTASRRVGSARR